MCLPLNTDILKERKDCLLKVDAVRTGYGKKEVLKSISLEAMEGKIIAMIGPNGSGKSTALRAIFGLVRTWGGTIMFDGKSCVGQTPAALIRYGLVYVPQGNRVFADLTVQQNLTVSLQDLRKTDILCRLDEMAMLFPAVKAHMQKRAGALSGGEKQQVALAMGLIKKPKMLLLDEPSLGLAQNILSDVFEKLYHINEKVGVTILLVEHKIREVFRIADWVFGLRRGEIVEQGKPEIIDDTKLKNIFLG